MRYTYKSAKVNIKALVVLLVVTAGLGGSFLVAREMRQERLWRTALADGQAAFQNEDWAAAWENFKVYLGKHPDDVDILKQYAKARLSCRPLGMEAVNGAISAYRRIIQVTPLEQMAYEKLAMLYAGIGNFQGLAHIARTRLERSPGDRKAQLWLADALVRLGKNSDARARLTAFVTELETLPDKHVEYVQACALLSQIDESTGARTRALEYLNTAVAYLPDSVEALVHRARFLRAAPEIAGMSRDDRLAGARRDLEAADALGTNNPRLLLALGQEWLAHEAYDRVEAELRACEKVPAQVLAEHFFDPLDWTVARFLLASELAVRKGGTDEGAALADDVLAVLTEKRHRVRVLPNAVALYIAQGRVKDARRSLDEYLKMTRTAQGPAGSSLRLAYLQALVAMAEDRLYDVIDLLQPAVVSDASRPELWQLVAEAYSRTDQTRRAVSAYTRYLSLRPHDPKMTLQLAREYLKLQNWTSAFETARLAESLDPPDIVVAKLLRLEANIYVNVSELAQLGAKPDPARFTALSAELAELRKQNPEKVDVRILQAIVANYLEKPAEAEKELLLAIKECDEPLRARMQLVRHYVSQKRMSDALACCRTACALHPEVAEPWLYLSSLNIRNADYEAAAECVRQGLKSAVGQWEKRALTIQLALVELSYLDRSVGIDLLTTLAAQDKQEVRARLLLLNLREIQQDPARAAQLITELREAEGESGLYWRLHQASLWLSSSQWRERQSDIKDYLQYCIVSDPGWSAPALLLAKLYENLQDLKRVEETYRQALARNPSATDVADKLMTLLEKQRRFSEAEEVLQQIQADPTVRSTWQIRRAVNAGDFSRAIEELTVRVSNNDRDAGSRILLARLVYWETRDAERAFTYLREAEALTPDSLALIAAKVSILRAEGQDQAAQKVLDDHVAHSRAFNAYAMRATYLAQEGDFAGAEKDFQTLTTFSEQGVAGYQLWSDFYARRQKLDRAVAVLEQGLTVYGEDLRLKRQLMKTLFARNQGQDRQRAIDILGTLEEKLPLDPELMRLRAALLLKEATPRARSAAREKLKDVVSVEPTSVQAHLMLIGILLDDGDYEEARDAAVRALGSNPQQAALLAAGAKAEFLLKHYQMAVEMARRALTEDPNQVDAQDLLVETALKTDDHRLLEEVRTHLDATTNLNDERQLLARVHTLVKMNLAETAIGDLQTYCHTEKGGRSVDALVTLGDLYRLTGDMDQAWQRTEQAERIDPNSPVVIHARVLLLIAQDRLEDLADLASTRLMIDGQNAETQMRAASALTESDAPRLRGVGLKLYEHVLTVSPKLLKARVGLAFALCRTGNNERSMEICRELLDEYPNKIEVLNDLAWMLQEDQHDYVKALDLVNRGLGLARNDLAQVYLLDTRGTILIHLGRLDEAKADFEKVVALSTLDTELKAKAFLQLGRICVKLNEFSRAGEHLAHALDIDHKMAVFSKAERSEITGLMEKIGVQTPRKVGK